MYHGVETVTNSQIWKRNLWKQAIINIKFKIPTFKHLNHKTFSFHHHILRLLNFVKKAFKQKKTFFPRLIMFAGFLQKNLIKRTIKTFLRKNTNCYAFSSKVATFIVFEKESSVFFSKLIHSSGKPQIFDVLGIPTIPVPSYCKFATIRSKKFLIFSRLNKLADVAWRQWRTSGIKNVRNSAFEMEFFLPCSKNWAKKTILEDICFFEDFSKAVC